MKQLSRFLKQLIHFFFKKFLPIHYAKFIGVRLGKNCRLIDVKYSSEPYLISMGDHVSATSVRFETHDGGIWVLRDQYPDNDIVKPITIGDNVFIGYGAVILPGVTIGSNVVIGAYAVVSKDIPSGSIAAGIPARVIRSIDEYKNKVLALSKSTKQMTPKEKRKFYLSLYNKI